MPAIHWIGTGLSAIPGLRAARIAELVAEQAEARAEARTDG